MSQQLVKIYETSNFRSVSRIPGKDITPREKSLPLLRTGRAISPGGWHSVWGANGGDQGRILHWNARFCDHLNHFLPICPPWVNMEFGTADLCSEAVRASERAESRLREMRTRLGYWMEIGRSIRYDSIYVYKNHRYLQMSQTWRILVNLL